MRNARALVLNFFNVIPFTGRGVISLLAGAALVIAIGVRKQDLIAGIIGATLLVIPFIILICGGLFRSGLKRKLSLNSFFMPGALSHAPVRGVIEISGCNLLVIFRLKVTRSFISVSGTSSTGFVTPTHLISGFEKSSPRQLSDVTIFPHRGIWQLNGIRLTLIDTFGLTKLSWLYELEHEVEVSPPMIPILPLPMVSATAQAGDLQTQTLERAGDLFDIKPYDPSDGIKRILWKTFARSGQLVVRRPEPAVLPEGEMPIFVLARREDDEVAGAFLGFLRTLEEARIVPVFGTDGLESGAGELSTSAGFLTNVEQIRHALNICAFHPYAGKGTSLAAYLAGIQSSGRSFPQALVFISEELTTQISLLSTAAQTFGVQLIFAEVPQLFRQHAWGEVQQKTKRVRLSGDSRELVRCELAGYAI